MRALAGLYRIDLGMVPDIVRFPPVDFEIYFQNIGQKNDDNRALIEQLARRITEEQGEKAQGVAAEIATHFTEMRFDEAAHLIEQEIENYTGNRATQEEKAYAERMRNLLNGMRSFQKIKEKIITFVNRQDAGVLLLNVPERGRVIVKEANPDTLLIRQENDTLELPWAEAGPAIFLRLSVRALGGQLDTEQREAIRTYTEIFQLDATNPDTRQRKGRRQK
jgi:hypothetical protein